MRRFKTFPRRVTDIGEQEFWSTLRVRKGRPGSDLLTQAIELGRAGKRRRAYRLLGQHHRATLQEEWGFTAEEARRQPAPEPKALHDLLNYKITCWHTQVVRFGGKMDWIPEALPIDCVSGFHYFAWLDPAITAYIQTGDERCGDFVTDIVSQYYAARKDSRWRDQIAAYVFCALGSGCKTPRFLRAYLALLNTSVPSPETVEQFAKSFLGFARALEMYLQEFIAHNIVMTATKALLQIARLFPEFAESPRWDRRAAELLVRQATEGFFRDGGHAERVWGYGYGTLSNVGTAYELARRYGGLGQDDGKVLRTIRKGYQWYAKSLGPEPDCLTPSFGDGALHSGSNILDEGVRFFPEGSGRSLGIDRTKSYLLRDSGFAAMRNGDDRDATYINTTFGTFAGWHSHQDMLSMNLWSKGQPLLEELCRFGPYANPLDQLFRAPESHNLVLIDGMVYDCRHEKAHNVVWHSTDEVDYFSAYHRAYYYYVFGRETGDFSPNIEAQVWRTILFVKDPGYAVVLDSVTNMNRPDFNRSITQYWHSPFPFRVVKPGLVRTRGTEACLIAYAHADGLHRLETGKDFAGQEVAHLGVAPERYSLRARRWMPLDWHGRIGFTTVLYPFRGKMPDVSVRPVSAEAIGLWDADAIEVRRPGGTDVIVLNPQMQQGVSYRGNAVKGCAYAKLAGRREGIQL